MTAGAALLVAGRARDHRGGITRAQAAIDSGAAARALDRLVHVSNA
jgi:anthranilate phosphoribosyltransferase